MLKSNFILLKFITIIFLFISCNAEDENSLENLNKGLFPNIIISTSSPPALWPPSLLELNIKISDSFTNQDVESVIEMSNKWNQATDYNPTIFGLSSANRTANLDYPNIESYKKDSEFGIYLKKKWFDNVSQSALAVTYSSGYQVNAGTPNEYIELFSADIIFNNDRYEFGHDQVAGEFDFASIVIHELGHFAGLEHYTGIEDSVMKPRIKSKDVRRDLYPIDTGNIRALYSGYTNIKGMYLGDLPEPQKGDEVTIIHEYLPGGICLHYLNGIFYHIH